MPETLVYQGFQGDHYFAPGAGVAADMAMNAARITRASAASIRFGAMPDFDHFDDQQLVRDGASHAPIAGALIQ